jgi:hypothetical protein
MDVASAAATGFGSTKYQAPAATAHVHRKALGASNRLRMLATWDASVLREYNDVVIASGAALNSLDVACWFFVLIHVATEVGRFR